MASKFGDILEGVSDDPRETKPRKLYNHVLKPDMVSHTWSLVDSFDDTPREQFLPVICEAGLLLLHLFT